jgi:glycosyltransferase involved in cell wall biosynthesis
LLHQQPQDLATESLQRIARAEETLQELESEFFNSAKAAISSDSTGQRSHARPRKAIIQIPCFNEEQTLAITLRALPRQLNGIGCVEWLIIDDGSSDQTSQVAREMGVDHVVRLPRNQGLARAFSAGIEESLRQGADIIINTDADNQYCADDIQKLVDPIVEGRSEFVVGARPISTTPHFSRMKKTLQWWGSWVVRRVSKTNIPDAPSGFRAMSRSTAMQLNVFSEYTYTLETIIQAGQKNMAISSVPIRTNPDLRPSRLLRSIPSYVGRSASTIVRIFMTYRPFQFFAIPGTICSAVGFMLCVRYLLFLLAGSGAGHIHSLILASLMLGMGLTGIVVGLMADLISVNRKLLEKIDWRLQQLEERIPQK